FVSNSHFGDIGLNKIGKIFWQGLYAKFAVYDTQGSPATYATGASHCAHRYFHGNFLIIKNLVKIDVKNTVRHRVKLNILKDGVDFCASQVYYNGVYVWSVNQVFKCNFFC